MPEATVDKVSEKVVPISDKKEEEKVPEFDAKFPPIDKLGSHFYDNEAGTFWVGIPLNNDPLVLVAVLDAQKLPMLNALGDFMVRQARRAELMGKPKQGGVVDRLRTMFK